MTPQQHARIEALAGLIDFLDLLDGDCDLEPEEDRCAAHDDDPRYRHVASLSEIGDADDAEPEEDLGASEDEGTGVSRAGIGCPEFDGI